MQCCSICAYTTPFPSYLLRHMLTHDAARSLRCNECGSQFKTTSAFNLHVREKHASNAHVCQTCGAEFTHKRTLDRHKLCHSDYMHFCCTLCGYQCRRKQDLDRHLRAMHSGRPHRKIHEEHLASFFCALDITFTREYTVNAPTFGGRKFARIDFYIPFLEWGDLLFECDELQHTAYSVANECQRMAAIYAFHKQKHPGRRLHIVRFNPHPYKQDGTIKKPTDEERKSSIQECLAYVPKTHFEITYLFYRNIGCVPAVTLDQNYTLREYVRTVRTAELSEPP